MPDGVEVGWSDLYQAESVTPRKDAAKRFYFIAFRNQADGAAGEQAERQRGPALGLGGPRREGEQRLLAVVHRRWCKDLCRETKGRVLAREKEAREQGSLEEKRVRRISRKASSPNTNSQRLRKKRREETLSLSLSFSRCLSRPFSSG